MRRLAILQCADQGPLESLVAMLNSVGYGCALPSEALRSRLRSLGCDTVLSPADLTRGMGYDPPAPLPEAGTADMERAALYVDVKAHRNGPKVWREWPALKGRTLWYRINGSRPEHVINERGDMGDEINPPCPVLTPNLWYAEEGPWGGRAYACWPPFVRFGEYGPRRAWNGGGPWDDSVCLLHNAKGWGYRALFPAMRRLGVRIYGASSPDGLIQHSQVRHLLSRALCMVHLKSNDAPGYSLLEALAAGCPVVCTRRLIWRCRMHDLLIPGKTCLVFDRETHDPLSDADVADCTREVGEHLDRLRDPVENRRIGLAGHERLKDVMWREDRDGESLRGFFRRNFG